MILATVRRARWARTRTHILDALTAVRDGGDPAPHIDAATDAAPWYVSRIGFDPKQNLTHARTCFTEGVTRVGVWHLVTALYDMPGAHVGVCSSCGAHTSGPNFCTGCGHALAA